MAPGRDQSSHENEENQPLLHKQGPPTYEQEHHRNQSFHARHEPFKGHRHLQLAGDEVDGAFWFMNPTRAKFSYHGDADAVYDDGGSEEYQAQDQQTASKDTTHSGQSGIEYNWTSRDNRKGRHSLTIHEYPGGSNYQTPYTRFRAVLSGIWRMCTTFNGWDISFINAILFTAAVVVLLGNAILSVIPYIDPTWKPPQEITYVEGGLTFIGCFFFLLSSSLSWLEALNADQKGCFGWKLEEASSQDGFEHGQRTRLVPDFDCIHRKHNWYNLFGDFKSDAPSQQSNGDTPNNASKSGSETQPQWRRLPSWRDLTTHFIYDIGFVTCSILLCSSIVYCSAALASFLSVLLYGYIANWIRIPQFIAGIGFICSSILFMLETQTHWLMPEWRAIGWHISFWNFIGSVGFTLCAAFAWTSMWPDPQWAEYQLAYSYLWGSFGFVLGGLIQWFEALDKHPVERKSVES